MFYSVNFMLCYFLGANAELAVFFITLKYICA